MSTDRSKLDLETLSDELDVRDFLTVGGEVSSKLLLLPVERTESLREKSLVKARDGAPGTTTNRLRTGWAYA